MLRYRALSLAVSHTLIFNFHFNGWSLLKLWFIFLLVGHWSHSYIYQILLYLSFYSRVIRYFYIYLSIRWSSDTFIFIFLFSGRQILLYLSVFAGHQILLYLSVYSLVVRYFYIYLLIQLVFLRWISLAFGTGPTSTHSVPTIPGKPGILSFSFPGLENAWNLLKSAKNLEF